MGGARDHRRRAQPAGRPAQGRQVLAGLGLGLAVAGGAKALGIHRGGARPGALPCPGGHPPPSPVPHGQDPRRPPRPDDAHPRPPPARPCPQGGDEAIAAGWTRNPDARLVVIDVFAKVRGNTPPGPVRLRRRLRRHEPRQAPGRHLRRGRRPGPPRPQGWLPRTSCRKSPAPTAWPEQRTPPSSSNAPAAPADGVLHVTGRDVEEAEYAHGLPTRRRRVAPAGRPSRRPRPVRHPRHHHAPRPPAPWQPPKAIAEGTGLSYENVRKTCQRMASTANSASTPPATTACPAPRPGQTSPASQPSLTTPPPAPTPTTTRDRTLLAVPAVPAGEEHHQA